MSILLVWCIRVGIIALLVLPRVTSFPLFIPLIFPSSLAFLLEASSRLASLISLAIVLVMVLVNHFVISGEWFVLAFYVVIISSIRVSSRVCIICFTLCLLLVLLVFFLLLFL